MADDLTTISRLPTSEVIRLYIHYYNAVNRWEIKNPNVSSLDNLRQKQALYAAEIDERVPVRS